MKNLERGELGRAKPVVRASPCWGRQNVNKTRGGNYRKPVKREAGYHEWGRDQEIVGRGEWMTRKWSYRIPGHLCSDRFSNGSLPGLLGEKFFGVRVHTAISGLPPSSAKND